MTSYLYSKGFQCSSLEDILANKLKKLNSNSPKSGDDRRSSNNSVINFNANVSPTNRSPGSSSKKMYHVNIHQNIKDTTINTNNNSPNASNNNINHGKIMRVIRGGGGKDYNSNQNFFFSKMLNADSTNNKPDAKKSLDKLRREKYEQELKYLDNNDLNNSKESENIFDEDMKKWKTPHKDQKDKGGILNFFTKIMK